MIMVVGARPNFVKAAPVLAALRGETDCLLVHTGQHYDTLMSDVFFQDLDLPSPDVNLGVGSGTHAQQTAEVMVAFEGFLLENDCDLVLVVGDVNSTLAASLAAAKLGIPVAHIEAGLRSNNWSMPEEINRVLTDRLSDWLFTPSADADENLAREGIDESSIHRVGNVMIDTLTRIRPTARSRHDRIRTDLDLPTRYGVATLHRPSNLRAPVLGQILDAIDSLASDLPMILVAHPRTREAIVNLVDPTSLRLKLVDPLGYVDFLALIDQSEVVLTDSGGLQEETTVLGIPCVTLRDETERPITITLGTNILAGTETDSILSTAAEALETGRRDTNIPLWDGNTGERIAAILLR